MKKFKLFIKRGGINVKLRKNLDISLVVVLILVLVSISTIGAEEPRYGGEIIIGMPTDLVTLNPIMIADVYSFLMSKQINDVLVGLNEYLEPIPMLAKSWEVLDLVTYIFHLRREVKFHDGTKFTAQDVKFTFEAVLDPDLGSPSRTWFLPIKEMEIIDDYTLKIVLHEPMAPFIIQVISMMPIVPKHVIEEIGHDDFAFAPIGTGPFQFVRWVPGDYLKLEAFDGHWRGRPYLDTVIFRHIPEASVRIMELEAGGIDFSYGIPPEDFARLEADPNITTVRFFALAYAYVKVQLDHPILNNKLVRQAIAYAIDADLIVETILEGLARPATGPLPPGTWAFNPDVRHYPHDPERAMQLLSEAGFPDGFQVNLIRGPGEIGLLIVTAIKEQLAAVGIEVTIEILEWGLLLDRYFAGDFELLHVGWTGIVDPDYGMFSLFHTDGDFNVMGYSNPEVDTLLELGRRTFDLGTRKIIYHRLQEILAEELPHIFLTWAYSLRAYNPRLRGFIHASRRYGGPLNDLWQVWWAN